MILIPDKKLAILLPWKTASQTLRARLGSLDTSPYPQFFYFNPYLNTVVHQHITLGQFMALPEARKSWRLAVFVRNPYDRVASGFIQIQRDMAAQPRAHFPAAWIKDLVLEQIAQNRQRIILSNGDMNVWFRGLPAQLLLNSGQNSNLPLHPCHYWTHLDGKQRVDFIGTVENFEADFIRLCETFDIRGAGDGNANVTTGIGSKADGNGYRHASQFDPDVAARIERIFSADFDIFGYPRLTSG